MGIRQNLRKSRKYRWFRRLVRVLVALVVLFVVIVLFVRSPWGQDIIVSKVVGYVSGKTKTKVALDRLFVTFSGNVHAEGLFLADQQGDTLFYAKKLEANLPISPLIFGNELDLNSLEWDGLTAHIERKVDSEKFNFDFLLDAFSATDSEATVDTSKPLQINLGSFDFQQFNVSYSDAYLGIESKLKLGKLLLDAAHTDFADMRFEIDQLELSNTQIEYKQTKPFASQEDSTESTSPYIILRQLKMANVKVNYNSIPDKILADLQLNNFILKLPKADLVKNDFEIGEISLSNSEIDIRTEDSKTGPKEPTKTKFEWPDYLLRADKISLQNNRFSFKVVNDSLENGFSQNIVLSDIGLTANDIDYGKKKANLQISELTFQEKSGFKLNRFSLDALFGETSASLSNFIISTGNSSIDGKIDLKYASVDQLFDTPEKTTLALEIPDFSVDLKDAFAFLPDLAKNKYLQKAAQKDFMGHISANGTLEEIQIQNMEVDWGELTSLTARGRLKNPTEVDSLFFDISNLKAVSERQDVLRFVSETDLGISVPKTVRIEGWAKGGLNDLETDAILKIPEGTAHLTGNYEGRNQPYFDGKLQVDNLELGTLLVNPKIGRVSFVMDASANGERLNTLNAKLKTDFTELTYNGYDFSKLKLNGDIQNGKGIIDLNFKDKNLDFDADAKIALDSLSTNILFNVNLKGADLYALGITKNPIRARAKLDVDFKGSAENFLLTGSVSDGLVISNKEQYRMDDLVFTASLNETLSDVKINSTFLNGSLLSNTSLKGLELALRQQFDTYFLSREEINESLNPVTLKMNLTLASTPILTEVFFDGVEKLDTISATANFDEATQKLYARIDLPSLTYQGTKLDSLKAQIHGSDLSMNFNAGVKAITSGPISIQKTQLQGQLKNKLLSLDFLAFDKNEKLMHIASEVSIAMDTIRVKMLPDGLILNKQKWIIPKDNATYIADKYLGFKDLRLTRNGEELLLSNTMSKIQHEHIGIAFKDFRLQSVLSLLNPDEKLVAGMLNGDLVIDFPFGDFGLLADLRIDKLNVMQNPMGNLSLKASSKESKRYDFNLAVKDGGLDLDLIGDYIADVEGAKLNLDLDLNSLQLQFIEGVTKDIIKDSNGFLSGKFKVSGTTANPIYNGQLNFNDADMNVVALNAGFKISREDIKVDNKGIYFNNFVISDVNESTFSIDGNIGTETYINPSFDLHLLAKKFQVLNSKKGDNDLFYGQGEIDADILVKGTLAYPKVRGQIKVGEGTDFTYVVPESQLDVQERDGTVIFVNRENPDDILTRRDKEEATSIFKGLDVSTVLQVDEGAVFNILIDERTGDNLKVLGNAELNLDITPNGSVNLAGRYELKSGHYETNLYNLVKRKFDIKSGSTITWSGDPTDAVMDVTAVYEIETSASPLMASVTSGGDASLSSKFRQTLPFLVNLNVDGRLLQPKLSFGLDMQEEDQGSLGGAVYDRIQQLNEQESELNKQVFSLLALNRFFPDSGSDGSSGGAAAIARNNVNKVLASELNTVSDKVFGNTGFEVDFGLDSFTDYQGNSPTDRTQLNINARKKLFNDRLIITAGSAVDVQGSAQESQGQTPIIGNLNVEYLLTADGRYRLDGFQRSEYENAIDGQLTVTGLALILNWEFNKLSEIFSPIKTEKIKVDKKKKIKQDGVDPIRNDKN